MNNSLLIFLKFTYSRFIIIPLFIKVFIISESQQDTRIKAFHILDFFELTSDLTIAGGLQTCHFGRIELFHENHWPRVLSLRILEN